MAEILRGAPVAAAFKEKTRREAENLKKRGITPTLAIMRVGEKNDDISYEKGAIKSCSSIGAEVKNVVLPYDVSEEEFFKILEELNGDPKIHGILMFRPLPNHLDDGKACRMLSSDKDIDGCTHNSLAGIFTGDKMGFAPCTAQAVIEILDYYGIDCTGKKVAVIGRSLVVGRPVSMMLMHRNATVTICHTKTEDVPAITRQADIVVACAGRMESVGAEYFKEDQIVIDVGIGWNEEKGKLCGDVRFDEAEQIAGAVTPVPGGVGAVTTAVLAAHVVEAAGRTI